jgi:hypothetical protein
MSIEATTLNSPVEFVIVGPSGGRDGILVRSNNAGLDIIGLAAEGADGRPSADILSVLFLNSDQLNVISSYSVHDTSPKRDSRISELKFAWKGFASPTSISKINEAFNLHLSDLYRAIKSQDVQELELAIAPVILSCTRANAIKMRLRRTILTTIALYVGVIILIIALALFEIVVNRVRF